MSSESRPRILYVEDDPDMLEAVRVMLEDGGWEVMTATSALEGLEAAAREMPDVALLDLMLEEVDSGVTLATRLRARRPRMPIYLLSSVGASLMRNQDISRLDLTGVLQKPMDAATLLSILDDALQQGAAPEGADD